VKRKVIFSLILFVLGVATSLFAAHFSSPRYWEIQRVRDESEKLLSQREPAQALDLLEYAGGRAKNQDKRDLLLSRACEIAQDSEALLDTVRLCTLAADGPKRMAQAQSLMILAKAHRELGQIDQAVEAYQRVVDEYWDFRQSVAAGRYLARLKLDALFAGRPGVETRGEMEKLVEKAGAPGVGDVLTRSVAVTKVIWQLDADRDPSAVIKEYLIKYASKDDRALLMDRLGAVIRTHPSGGILRKALRHLALPVRDGDENLIRFAAMQHEFPPSKQECAEALASLADTRSLVAEFDRVGAPADELRAQTAELLRQAERMKDVIALLKGIVDRTDKPAYYAEANLAYARALRFLWAEEDAAKRMEKIIDLWPEHGSICVRAAMEGSGLFTQLGLKEDAKRLLAKALAVAAPDERLILESHAAGLGFEIE